MFFEIVISVIFSLCRPDNQGSQSCVGLYEPDPRVPLCAMQVVGIAPAAGLPFAIPYIFGL